MPTIEQIYEGYFNYLTDEIFDAIFKAKDYNCKDFDIVKLELLLNLHKLLDNRENFLKKIEILQKHDMENK